VHKVAVLF